MHWKAAKDWEAALSWRVSSLSIKMTGKALARSYARASAGQVGVVGAGRLPLLVALSLVSKPKMGSRAPGAVTSDQALIASGRLGAFFASLLALSTDY